VLLLELSNPEPQASEFGIRIDDDRAADGWTHSQTAQARLWPGESAVLTISLAKDSGMVHGMRGLPARAGTQNLVPAGKGPLNLAHIVELQIFMHRPSKAHTLEIRSIRLARPISLKGIVDAFGRYAGADWPGKIHSEPDLIRLHERAAADLLAHPAPPGRDRFGGWRDGPKQAATGFFRTAKLDGRWWLVDPDGAPYISLGIDVVSRHESTIITGRESLFAALPKLGEPLAKHFGTVHQIHSGPVRSGKTFNFYEANLERAYGPDFAGRWKETSLARLKSWNF
jgi:hypothetical protein